MGVALDLAREAADAGEVPVGAVVLDAGGSIIGRGRNRREADGDPLAHAEVLAMRDAARNYGCFGDDFKDTDVIQLEDSHKSDDKSAKGIEKKPSVGGVGARNFAESSATDGNSRISAKKTWNLADCTLVVTLEPCPMCAGAALQAHVGHIVFGAWDAKLGACGSVWDIPRDPHVGARPEVLGGVRESECVNLLAKFFARKRSTGAANDRFLASS